MELKESIKNFPQKSGVYFMKDLLDSVIYVGKAKNLKKRVSSYFLKQHEVKTAVLMKNVKKIDFIITNSELDALILENVMIKKYQPRYNIKLKDDKTYPLIKITREEYPRVLETRRMVKDGGFYFGPYTNRSAMLSNLTFINKFFLLRKCKGPLKKRHYPCLYYHIKSCLAPCVKENIKEKYSEEVSKAKKLLSGDIKELEKRAKEQIALYSKNLDFEKAMKVRDSIIEIREIAEKQSIVDLNEKKRDYVSFYEDKGYISFVLLKKRDGKLTETKVYSGIANLFEEEDLRDFLLRYYEDKDNVPDIIYVDFKEHEVEDIKNSLQEVLGFTLNLKMARDSVDKVILSVCNENAKEEVIKIMNSEGKINVLTSLKEKLNLKSLPVSIEGIDITHFGNKFIAGSLVTFYNGKKDKRNYRIFNIKGVMGGKNDDYLSIAEVVTRRYSKLIEEGKNLPNLILIDGGKGQLNAAYKAIKEIEKRLSKEVLHLVSLIGLAKKKEEVFLLGEDGKVIPESILLEEGSLELRLLQEIRDEAHNFANSFNKKKRLKGFAFNLLKSIDGIGEAKSKKLLTYYGSLENVLCAPKEEIKDLLKIENEIVDKISMTIEYFLN